MPPEGRRFVSGLAMAAARVSTAADVASAASATASMLVTCGDCHRAMGRTPSPAAVSSRRDLGGVVGHMLEHDATVEDMFRGLVIPSATSWMVRHHYDAIEEFRGTLNQRRFGNPGLFDRAGYFQVLKSWSGGAG